jgi:hypothetical protein
LRDQAFLALLLLVGAGALASGLFQILLEGNASPVAIFDTVLGVAVLLVTWLFLAPLAAPLLFGDPDVRGGPLIRPYLPLPLAAASVSSYGSHRRPNSRSPPAGGVGGTRTRPLTPEPEIPRWADPLVEHPRPVTAAPGSRAPAARSPPPPPPRKEEPEEEPEAEDDAFPFPEVEIPPVPEPQRSAQAPDVIRELDLISAEIENPPRKRPSPSSDPGSSSAADTG